MSQANIPNITPDISITRDDAVNLVISSIAMEELGMSHILNAEGEKIQYVLGTLPGLSGPEATLSDILDVNKSVKDMVNAITKNEYMLQQKLERVIGVPLSVGPTGPSGSVGATGAVGPQGVTGVQGPEGPQGAQGVTGNTGTTGPRGPIGDTGSTGETGPLGPQGLTGPPAIIPFSSNTPVTVTSLMNGEAGVNSFVGQGASSTGANVVGTTINLLEADSNLAFSVPRNGVLISFTAFFSVSSIPAVSVGTITVHFQLFKSNASSNTFELIPESVISEDFTLPVTIGTISSGVITGLSVPVDAGDRILLLVSMTTNAVDVATTLNGYVSAGLSIN